MTRAWALSLAGYAIPTQINSSPASMRDDCVTGDARKWLPLERWHPTVSGGRTLYGLSAPWQHASVDGQCELPFAMPRRQTRMQLASVSYSRVPPSCTLSQRPAQAHSGDRIARKEADRCRESCVKIRA